MKTRDEFMRSNAELVRKCQLARHTGEDKCQLILTAIFSHPPKSYDTIMFMPSLDIRLLHALTEREVLTIINALNREGYIIESYPFQKYLIEIYKKSDDEKGDSI
jgi:hypothetical protein